MQLLEMVKSRVQVVLCACATCYFTLFLELVDAQLLMQFFPLLFKESKLFFKKGDDFFVIYLNSDILLSGCGGNFFNFLGKSDKRFCSSGAPTDEPPLHKLETKNLT